MNCFSLAKTQITLYPLGLSKTKVESIGCPKLHNIDPCITSHFKCILFVVHKFKKLLAILFIKVLIIPMPSETNNSTKKTIFHQILWL